MQNTSHSHSVHWSLDHAGSTCDDRAPANGGRQQCLGEVITTDTLAGLRAQVERLVERSREPVEVLVGQSSCATTP
jgi:hypothetical protein